MRTVDHDELCAGRDSGVLRRVECVVLGYGWEVEWCVGCSVKGCTEGGGGV